MSREGNGPFFLESLPHPFFIPTLWNKAHHVHEIRSSGMMVPPPLTGRSGRPVIGYCLAGVVPVARR